MSQHTRIYPQVAAHIARAVSILKKEANKRPKLREDLPKALTKKHRHWNEMAPKKREGQSSSSIKHFISHSTFRHI